MPLSGSNYSTGSWTPTIRGSSTAGTNTYSFQAGRYVRIGNLVTLTGGVLMSSNSVAMVGNLQIGGLPFTAATTGTQGWSGAIGSAKSLTKTAGFTQFGIAVDDASAVIKVIEFAKDATAPNLVTVANIAADGGFGYFSLVYQVA